MKSSLKIFFLLRSFVILILVELLLTPLFLFYPGELFPYAFPLNALLLILLAFPLLRVFVLHPMFREQEQICRRNHDRIKGYEIQLKEADTEQQVAGVLEENLIRQIEFQSSYNRAILDGESDIVIVTDGHNIQDANRAFFDFFSEYDTLEAFKAEHDCVCEYFEVIRKEGYVYENIDGELWSDYILNRPGKPHKVAIRRGDGLTILSARAQRILFEAADLVVISLHDITHLETRIQEQTAALNDNIRILRESEKKLHAITDSVKDGIILLDENGILSFMNPAARQLLGYEKGELAGRDFHRIIAPPEYRSAYEKGYADFARNGEGKVIGKTLELSAVRKDGTVFPISLSVNSLQIDGRWHGVGVLRDITEQKQYETAILDTKNRLEAAIRTSGVGIYDYPIPLSKAAYWSPEWAEILGYTKADLPSWDKMIDWIRTHIHPDDRQMHDEHIDDLFSKGRSYNVKKRMRHKKGHWITISSTAEVVEHDENGRPKRAIGAIQDITESVTLMEALQQNKERYQELVEDINDWIWEVDETGKFSYTSPRAKELLGYEPDELIGTDPLLLMPEEERARIGEQLMKLVESGEPFAAIENTLRRKDGSRVVVETNAQPVKDSEEKILGYRGINRDISDRKRLEAELHHKEELMISQSRQAAMGDMIAMIAHQWRQPITVIGMAINNLQVGLALETEIPMQKLEKTIETVSHQVQHLSKTIDDFRNFFKPNKTKEYARICDVLDNTILIIGKSLENNNITLDYDSTCQLSVYTFPNELIQVYLNILANAKDALKDHRINGAKISIRIEETDEWVKTYICDNGGGILPEIMERLGEPYMTSKDENGTGLGIYMSRIIIEKHMKGHLEWENRDDGACFIVSLPLESKG